MFPCTLMSVNVVKVQMKKFKVEVPEKTTRAEEREKRLKIKHILIQCIIEGS